MKTRIVTLTIIVLLALTAPAAGAPGRPADSEATTLNSGQWQCWSPPGVVPCGYALAVAGVTASDAWAVGPNGAIMHWDGALWQSVASPTTTSLAALDMLSAGDGWAVGAQGVILHWDGASW